MLIWISPEDMFHLGKNGKLYTSVACDDDYYEFTEITADEFEKIRNEGNRKEKIQKAHIILWEKN